MFNSSSLVLCEIFSLKGTYVLYVLSPKISSKSSDEDEDDDDEESELESLLDNDDDDPFDTKTKKYYISILEKTIQSII